MIRETLCIVSDKDDVLQCSLTTERVHEAILSNAGFDGWVTLIECFLYADETS